MGGRVLDGRFAWFSYVSAYSESLRQRPGLLERQRLPWTAGEGAVASNALPQSPFVFVVMLTLLVLLECPGQVVEGAVRHEVRYPGGELGDVARVKRGMEGVL